MYKVVAENYPFDFRSKKVRPWRVLNALKLKHALTEYSIFGNDYSNSDLKYAPYEVG